MPGPGHRRRSVKCGSGAATDRVRLYRTVLGGAVLCQRTCVPKNSKEKNKICICSTLQVASLIMFGLPKYSNQPSYQHVFSTKTLTNLKERARHLNLSATETPAAPSSHRSHISRLC